MQSKFLNEKILGMVQLPEEEEESQKTTRAPSVTEGIALEDSRSPQVSRAEVSFKFSKPVVSDPKVVGELLSKVKDSVVSGQLEVIQGILQSLGLQEQVSGYSTTTTSNLNIGKYGRYRKPSKKSDTLRDGRGRFVSEINLRNALKLASIAHVVKDMKNKANGGLVYRTGRLQLSMDLKPLTLKNNKLSIFYTYMVRPYAVFDPTLSSDPKATSARNPQRMFAEQIDAQARQLGLTRYKLDIKQHLRLKG